MAAIRADYLRADTAQGHAASLPYVLLGGGYDDPALVSGTSYNYVDLAQSLGYQFASTATQLNGASGQILGLFGTSWAPMTAMASRAQNSSQPRLSQMVSKALQVLEGGGGFFLVVESANIDKLSHSKDANFVAEVAELNAAVEVAIAWKDSHNQFDNTYIFVTADHETGGLSVPEQTIAPGTLPAMSFASTGHTGAEVPLFANWPPSIEGTVLDNTETFFLVQDAMDNMRGGQPPIVAGLSVSGVTASSATVQWTTTEPSSSRVVLSGGGQVLTFAAPGWGNTHSVTCAGLSFGTTYNLSAESTDLSEFTGTASGAFATTGGDPNAYVVAEPAAGAGTVSGTYQALSRAGDGLKQSIVETTDGNGAGLLAQYSLYTPVPAAQMDSLTLQATYSWTAGDGASDNPVAFIRVLAPDGASFWEPITFPFLAAPASSYVDASGKILVQFEDGATIKRERKDTLALDALFGVVVKNTRDAVAPTRPMLEAPVVNVNPLSVSVRWSDSAYETGYQVWRHSTATGWQILAEPGAGATSFVDTAVAMAATYNYVVRAFNEDAYFDSAPAAVTIPVVLLAPTNFRASAGKGSINLSWTDNNSAEGNYEVLRATAANGTFSRLALLSANTAAYADKISLVRGTTYYYRVRAVKNSTPGPESATVFATMR
jgi:hypothetical protein